MRKRITILLFALILTIFFLNDYILADTNLNEDYQLNIDDRLHISVWGHDDLERELSVGPDGRIYFPLVGELEAEAKTANQLREELVEELKQYLIIEAEQVNISVLDYRRKQVSLAGEIREPGYYELASGQRVTDAISQAGNETAQADLSQVVLTRDGEQYNLDIAAYERGEKPDENMLLKSGDMLRVPKNTIEVTIIGEVRSAGNYELEQGKRVSNLIAQAGGLTSDASSTIEYISLQESQELNVDNVLSEISDYNPKLEDGAMIKVNEQRFSWDRFFFFVGGINSLKDLIGF